MRRLLGVLALGLASPLVAQVEPPGVEDLIRQMSSRLALLESFRFTVTLAFDDVPVPDVKVKYAGAMEVSLRRPDRLRVSYRDELTAREVWFDGETVTVLSPDQKHWASVPGDASIDATLNRFAADYGASIPLDDLFFTDPYSVMMAGAKAHRYVGLSEIHGVACHHLIVGQEDVVWQVWIESSDRRLPRQVVITYSTLPMAPEFIAVIEEWDLNPTLPDSVFEPEIPADATQIDFRTLKETRP